MTTRIELKQMAKGQIKGNIGVLFVCTLIMSISSTILSSIYIIGPIAALFITPAFTIGLLGIYISLTSGVKPEIPRLFDGFSIVTKAFTLNILVALFTTLWSLLFVIPGIVKGLSYSMSYYILAENPNMSATEALNESKRIMNGHKMDLFVLSLSFFLWMLAVVFTLGIAIIYVGPYVAATTANFYNSIKGPTIINETTSAAPNLEF